MDDDNEDPLAHDQESMAVPGVPGTVCNASTLAKLLGVIEQTVTALARRGIMLRVGRSQYNWVFSVQRYCAHLRGLATGQGGNEAVAAEAAQARRRLAAEQADHVALKNARSRGELVLAKEVEAEWSSVLRTVRAGSVAVPSRCAARLPHLSLHDIREIDAEVRQMLSE